MCMRSRHRTRTVLGGITVNQLCPESDIVRVTESSVQCGRCCVFSSLTSPVTRKSLAWGLYSSHGLCWNVGAHGGVFCGLNGRWGNALMPAPIPSLAGHCLLLLVIAVCGRDLQSVDTGVAFARLPAFGWGAVGLDWAVGPGTEAGDAVLP